MGDEEMETMNINSPLGKSHCMHLKLGKPPEKADNWMGTETLGKPGISHDSSIFFLTKHLLQWLISIFYQTKYFLPNIT